ncbi:MAG TPA: hypothetical protein PLZ18_08780, partial [Ferruginibacter sp.]|nr:hypothetical protein [Ferruginibacter sp.]
MACKLINFETGISIKKILPVQNREDNDLMKQTKYYSSVFASSEASGAGLSAAGTSFTFFT